MLETKNMFDPQLWQTSQIHYNIFYYAGANCEGIEAAVILGENQSCSLEIIAKAIYTLLQVRSTNVEIGAQLWHIGTGE